MDLAARGLGVRAAAQRMGRSVNTVKQQRSSAIRKLGATSMPHAVAIAIAEGLVQVSDRR